jgi:hypothetical protein
MSNLPGGFYKAVEGARRRRAMEMTGETRRIEARREVAEGVASMTWKE